MEKELHNFLESDLLNKYLVGDTTIKETQEVEYFISKYPEASDAFDKLQKNLEIIVPITELWFHFIADSVWIKN